MQNSTYTSLASSRLFTLALTALAACAVISCNDTTPPEFEPALAVISSTPDNGAEDVSSPTVTIKFNYDIDPSSVDVDDSSVVLTSQGGGIVPVQTLKAVEGEGLKITFASLAPHTLYALTLRGGSEGVVGSNGAELESDYTLEFTTKDSDTPITPPKMQLAVVESSIDHNDSGIPVNFEIDLAFNAQVDPASIVLDRGRDSAVFLQDNTTTTLIPLALASHTVDDSGRSHITFALASGLLVAGHHFSFVISEHGIPIPSTVAVLKDLEGKSVRSFARNFRTGL